MPEDEVQTQENQVLRVPSEPRQEPNETEAPNNNEAKPMLATHKHSSADTVVATEINSPLRKPSDGSSDGTEPKEDKGDGKVEFTPKEIWRYRLEGIRVVIGGVFIHLVLGTFYLWGSISVYVSSYLLQHDDAADINTVKLVFPIMLIAINATITIGLKISKKFGEKLTCFVGIFIIALCTFVSSYIQNFAGFTIVYGIIYGLASGMIYMTPVNAGWQYFPHRKGVVSGVIIGGFGFGTLIFNYVALAIVNPDNAKATVKFEGNAYFTADIYNKVPMMLRILSACYLGLGWIGALLITVPKVRPSNYPAVKKVEPTANAIVVVEPEGKRIKRDADTIWEGVKHPACFLLFIITAFSSYYGLMIANNYKVFGLTKINDDLFLTTVGAVGSAMNGCSRIGWATATDRFGFKRVFGVLLILQLIVTASFYYISDIRALFVIWYLVSMSCEGGQLSMLPAATYRAFGAKKGPLIYGFVYAGFTVSNLCAFFMTKYGQLTIGWIAIFWICFAFTIVAIIINFFIIETPDLERGYTQIQWADFGLKFSKSNKVSSEKALQETKP